MKKKNMFLLAPFIGGESAKSKKERKKKWNKIKRSSSEVYILFAASFALRSTHSLVYSVTGVCWHTFFFDSLWRNFMLFSYFVFFIILFSLDSRSNAPYPRIYSLHCAIALDFLHDSKSKRGQSRFAVTILWIAHRPAPVNRCKKNVRQDR